MSKNQMTFSLGGRLRKSMLGLADWIENFWGVASKYEAPKRLSHQYGVTSDVDVAMHFFRIMLDHAGLSRTSSILEIGCGAGRNAGPLKYYLTEPGRYEGFDIMPEGIEHCTRQVTPHFPSFRFQRVDLFNSYYNPSGKVASSDFRFPYPDGEFDLVLATSVMTHMRPEEARHYVAESARVLKPGGVAMHTFFVLDAQGEEAVRKDTALHPFRFEVDGFRTSDPKYPEAAVAMPEATVRSMYEDAGFEIEILPAEWSQGDRPVSFQNVVIGRKTGGRA
jgi:SAM-dependent methyltransferase